MARGAGQTARHSADRRPLSSASHSPPPSKTKDQASGVRPVFSGNENSSGFFSSVIRTPYEKLIGSSRRRQQFPANRSYLPQFVRQSTEHMILSCQSQGPHTRSVAFARPASASDPPQHPRTHASRTFPRNSSRQIASHHLALPRADPHNRPSIRGPSAPYSQINTRTPHTAER